MKYTIKVEMEINVKAETAQEAYKISQNIPVPNVVNRDTKRIRDENGNDCNVSFQDNEITNEKKLRVWYIPQIPGKTIYVNVESINNGLLVAATLVKLSKFEFENNIKPDYSDALGLEEFVYGEWMEYESKEGEEFDELFNKYLEENKI